MKAPPWRPPRNMMRTFSSPPGYARRSVHCALFLAATIGPSATLARQRTSVVPPGLKTLPDIELATPFVVSELKGTISSSRHQPLSEAEFVLEVAHNLFVGVFTDITGSFTLSTTTSTLLSHGIPPGTYRFKARREGFQSTVGTVIISSAAPKHNAMDIELQPGPDGDDRTLEQRASDWERAQLPPCSPGANRNPKRRKYPGSLLDLPVSIGLCTVRTPEIAVTKKATHRFMLEAGGSLGVKRVQCMLGLFSGLWERNFDGCLDGEPLLKADWTVWLGDQVVSRGSSPLEDHGSGLAKVMGYFDGEAGKKYVIEVKFLKDGSAINAADPHLIVQ